MNINVITKMNGVGLEADALLLRDILTDHTVNIIDWERPTVKAPANINIHLEHIRKEFIHLAPYNIAIPNPEWFEDTFKPYLRNINIVLCKTRHCENIFSQMHPNCVYCGWTSRDCYIPNYKKHMLFCHLAGRSSHKGSEFVRDCWTSDPKLPMLYFQKYTDIHKFKFNQGNVMVQRTRVKDIREIMNTALFHLCCSKAEGFGHYITEALSTGGIVITTDAPPMNEIITSDLGFLVPSRVCGKHRLSNEYCVDSKALHDVVKQAYATDPKVLIEMSERARATYLQRDADFRERIKTIIAKCTTN